MDILTKPRKSWYLSLVDRTARPRFDVFPVFANLSAFSSLLADISQQFEAYDKVVAIDAIGFVLGGALAATSQKPFIPIRKLGKLPLSNLETRTFDDWDGKKGLEIKREWINKGDQILLVDEWIGEGFQIKAAIDMIEALGGTIIGIACLYMHPDFDSNLELAKKYNMFAANCLVCKYFECRCT